MGSRQSLIGCSSRSGRCGRCRPCRGGYRRRRNALKWHAPRHFLLPSSNPTKHSSHPTRHLDSMACAWSCGYRPDDGGNLPDPKPSRCPHECTAQTAGSASLDALSRTIAQVPVRRNSRTHPASAARMPDNTRGRLTHSCVLCLPRLSRDPFTTSCLY